MFFSNLNFKRIEKYGVNRNILKGYSIRYSPSETSTLKFANSQNYIYIPSENSVFSSLFSYLDLNFDVLHAATNNRYADKNDLRLIYLGVIGFF